MPTYENWLLQMQQVGDKLQALWLILIVLLQRIQDGTELLKGMTPKIKKKGDELIPPVLQITQEFTGSIEPAVKKAEDALIATLKRKEGGDYFVKLKEAGDETIMKAVRNMYRFFDTHPSAWDTVRRMNPDSFRLVQQP